MNVFFSPVSLGGQRTSHLHRETAHPQSKPTSPFRREYLCVFFIGYANVFLCEQGLLKFVFPLGLVYFAEYFINQGLVSSGASHPSPCCSASLFLVLDCQVWAVFSPTWRCIYVRIDSFSDGTPVFPQVCPVPRWTIPLVSSPPQIHFLKPHVDLKSV